VGVTDPVSYTVPAGYRAVVRDIDTYNGGDLLQFASYFEGNDLQTIWGVQWTNVNAWSNQWRGRQVFYAGESFHFRADSGVDVTISGYLLRD
jgi:hypothetical protein